jgi:hypothetical protein
MKISKFASMTTGLVLMLIGAQLVLVKSYRLTPSATRFMAEHFSQNGESQMTNPVSGNALSSSSFNPSGQTWPYYKTIQGGSVPGSGAATVPAQLGSFVSRVPPGYQARFAPPRWMMWPALFVGTVLFLHGLALRA